MVVLLVGSGACSGGDDDKASFDETGNAIAESGGGGDAAEDEGGDGGAESADAPSLGLPAGEPIQSGRAIIATAEVSLEVEDVVRAARRASDAASAVGGFLAQQVANPDDGIVTLTLRVPPEEFSTVMGELEGLGDVLEQRIDTQDVTEQVVDLESRIASARVSVERVRELLDRSGDVAQLATVEGELARREAELESLLGRQRVLDDQVSLATIHLDLREPTAVEEEEDEPLPGFFGGLRRGWDGFVTSASVVVTGLGYALPFLVLAVVVGIGWLWVRRQRSPARPA